MSYHPTMQDFLDSVDEVGERFPDVGDSIEEGIIAPYLVCNHGGEVTLTRRDFDEFAARGYRHIGSILFHSVHWQLVTDNEYSGPKFEGIDADMKPLTSDAHRWLKKNHH